MAMGLLTQRIQADQSRGNVHAPKRIVMPNRYLDQGVEGLSDQMEVSFLFSALPVVEPIGVVSVKAIQEIAAVERCGLT